MSLYLNLKINQNCKIQDLLGINLCLVGVNLSKEKLMNYNLDCKLKFNFVLNIT